MAQQSTTARLLVRYGRHKEGETIRGSLAAELVAQGMAVDVSGRKPALKAAKGKGKGASPETKAEAAAPENKADEPGFEA